MKNIIQSSLFSVCLHGVLLACCLAVPAQKLVPLFCAGDSALTLTSLSIYQPGAPFPGDSLSLPEQRGETADQAAEELEENNPDTLALEPPDAPAAKSPAVPPQENKKNTERPVKAGKPALFMGGDARAKGIAGGLTADTGIHPYYPLGARLRGEEGIVKVEAHVGVDGCVLDCAVVKSSGFPALDNAALNAVNRAHFVSAQSLPIKTGSETVLTFRFDLVD